MPDPTSCFHRPAVAAAGLVVGGALWGVIWIPIRALEALGLHGAWSGVAIYSAAAVLLLPLAWRRRAGLAARWRGFVLCGLLTGAAFSFYATSLTLTEVVRAILLFYLTPVWSTALGIAFLGERAGAARLMALALGFGGMAVVLGGGGGGLPWPRNPGDWLALGSGLAWAFGSMQLYRMGAVAVPEQIVAFVWGSLAVSLVTIVIGGAVFGAHPAAADIAAALPWILLTALYLLPMLTLTIWPAAVLLPGTVGLLLMSDVLVGVASAAALSGEPFGWREAAGSAMIVGAGLVEMLGKRGPVPPVSPGAGRPRPRRTRR